jgi:hypothetical protein
MMRKIRLSQKILSRAAITFLVLILLSGFGWFNSKVSYKYEVQDTVYAKQPLSQHQKDILVDIVSSKIVFISCIVMLIFTLYLIQVEPTFKGLVYYANKRPMMSKSQ